MTELQKKLRGVLGFPVTPFRADLSLDLNGLAANVERMAGHPFCAMVAAAGAGECFSLTPDEAVQVVEAAVRAAGGKLPVFGAVGYNAAVAAEMAQRMEKAGAAGLLVMPPYFTNAPGDGMLRYYEAIGAASGLPLMGYSRDWAAFTSAALVKLVERVPTLQFWKDGQGDSRRLLQLIDKVGDRLAWIGGIGDDCAGVYFAAGVQGYTSGLSNVAPALCLALGEAGLAGDFARLNEILADYVLPFYAIRARVRGYEVAATKAAMRLLGRPAGSVRPPLVDVTPAENEEIQRILATWGEFLTES